MLCSIELNYDVLCNYDLKEQGCWKKLSRMSLFDAPDPLPFIH